MRAVLAAASFAIVALAACKFPELPPVSEDGGDDVRCDVEGPDPDCPADQPVCANGLCSGHCVSDAECSGRPASEKVCLSGVGACVACDENDAQAEPGTAEDECTVLTSAVCDGETHACRPCERHSECFSGVCDAGRCVDVPDVIYMATDGADQVCGSRAGPCRTMQAAIDRAVSTSATHILMAPDAIAYLSSASGVAAVISGERLDIVGFGAALRRGSDGNVLDIEGGSDVRIEGLVIQNAIGTGFEALYCNGSTLSLYQVGISNNQGRGLRTVACPLSVERSLIVNNDQGGLDISFSTVRLRNNFIAGNGDPSATTGGVRIDTALSGSVFEFNTLALNSTQVGIASGVRCISPGLVARNNIVATVAGQQNTDANCTFEYSLFTPGPAPSGAGNMQVVDLDAYMFVGGTDFHIQPGSVATGKASSANLSEGALIDFDGDPRTPGSTTVDVGADEIP